MPVFVFLSDIARVVFFRVSVAARVLAVSLQMVANHLVWVGLLETNASLYSSAFHMIHTQAIFEFNGYELGCLSGQRELYRVVMSLVPG